jgi:hypothetical protein
MDPFGIQEQLGDLDDMVFTVFSLGHPTKRIFSVGANIQLKCLRLPPDGFQLNSAKLWKYRYQ